MAELLFARLSPELRLFAIRKLGRFAAETSLASMHEEVKTLASAAARGDAAAAVEHVLLPLLRQLDAELPSVQTAKSGHLSKVCPAFLKDLVVYSTFSKAMRAFSGGSDRTRPESLQTFAVHVKVSLCIASMHFCQAMICIPSEHVQTLPCNHPSTYTVLSAPHWALWMVWMKD